MSTASRRSCSCTRRGGERFLIILLQPRPVAFSNQLQISPRRTSLCIRPAFLFRRRLSIEPGHTFPYATLYCAVYVLCFHLAIHFAYAAECSTSSSRDSHRHRDDDGDDLCKGGVEFQYVQFVCALFQEVTGNSLKCVSK